MKRLMIVAIAMVMSLGISDKALADVWRRCGLRSSRGFGLQHGGRRFLGGSFRTPYGNVWNRCGLSSRYGRYGYYGPAHGTFGKIVVYGNLVTDVLGGLSQMSANDRALSMAEKEQDFRHGQIIKDQQIRAQRGTVLVKRGPIILQVTKPEQMQTQENEELRQEIEALKMELEKLKLQQELGKAKK